MNKTTRVLLSVLVIILLIPCSGFAQDDEKPNMVLCVTANADWSPEGGSWAEFDSLFTLASKNVVKKNKYIKMQVMVNHYYGADSDDFLVITEYNGSGLGIIEKAVEENAKLYKEWKPDKNDRDAYYKARAKYFKSGHSDEIYQIFQKVIN